VKTLKLSCAASPHSNENGGKAKKQKIYVTCSIIITVIPALFSLVMMIIIGVMLWAASPHTPTTTAVRLKAKII